jgi:hypothetical protein
MKSIVVLSFLICLVFSQSGVPTNTSSCTKPCYPNNPSQGTTCADGNTCGNNTNSGTVSPTQCPKVCFPNGANDTVKSNLSSSCATPCAVSQCAQTEVCTSHSDVNGNVCFNCDVPSTNTSNVTCPTLTCNTTSNLNGTNTTCQNGYKLDSNGCPTCTCNTPVCDPVVCSNNCTQYVVNPTTGCRTCDCVTNITCTAMVVCNNTCPNGFASSTNGCNNCNCSTNCPPINCAGIVCNTGFATTDGGCLTCNCKPCPAVTCANSASGAATCTNSAGCPSCDCPVKNNTCLRLCPNGYASPTSCDCVCPNATTVCAAACSNGYTTDANGCHTCTCAPPPSNVCTAVPCANLCTTYALDANGCQTCDCVTITCDLLASCTIACPYGRSQNSSGCSTCSCNPCPPVNCTKQATCAYGCQNDPSSGCPVCACAPAPSCDSGATAVSSANDGSVAPTGCNLMCSNGFIVQSGCVTCVCRSAPVCDCGARPTVTELCLDKSLASYTNTCIVEPNNTCHYYYQECPIAIQYVLNSGTFTSADLQQFLTDNRITIADVTFSATTNSKGQQVVTLFINANALPQGTTGTDVASSIQDSAQANGNSGVAYVLSGDSTSSTSFGNVFVVSLIGMLFALLM